MAPGKAGPEKVAGGLSSGCNFCPPARQPAGSGYIALLSFSEGGLKTERV